MLRPTTLLVAGIAAATPVILVGNSLWLLLNPWIVDAVYAVPGFPVDRFGLGDDARDELATRGVRAIRPGDDNVALLRAARLPDGGAAFDARELRHMRDVGGLVSALLFAWALALAVVVLAVPALCRLEGWRAVRRGLALGGGATAALAALVAVAMLVAFEATFEAFHGILFEGRSWRFGAETTLRRVYPDAFWAIVSVVAAAAVLLQVAVLGAVLRWLGRRDQRAPAS